MIWITILQICGAALIAGVFALLGVWISQRGAAAVVKQTFEAQRVLASDAALREWRKQQIAPYLEAANNRTHLWTQIKIQIATSKSDKGIPLSFAEQLFDPHYHNLMLTYQTGTAALTGEKGGSP